MRIAILLATIPVAAHGDVVRRHPSLMAANAPLYAVIRADPDPIIGAYILLSPGADRTAIADQLPRHCDAKVLDHLESLNVLVISMPFSAVDCVSAVNGVLYLEPAIPKLNSFNDRNRIETQAEIVQSAPYALDGSGIHVLIFDVNLIMPTHVDFIGRVHYGQDCPPGPGGCYVHSTHVAGTVGGSGLASSGHFRGMAPGVTFASYYLEFHDCEPGLPCNVEEHFLTNPGDIEKDYKDAIENGAVLANNSIGLPIAYLGLPFELYGDYGLTSALIDGIVMGKLGAPMRIMWAAGNDGSGHGTIPPPAPSKNAIVIGAINNYDETMASFSSVGPVDDGRIKPDLVAPGCTENPPPLAGKEATNRVEEETGVNSPTALGNDPYGHIQACGTSMATPTVTGSAALLMQDYRRLRQDPEFAWKFSDDDLSNASIRCLLVHTAKDLRTPGPDYRSGYGLIQIKDAVDLMRTGNFWVGEMGKTKVIKYFTNIMDGTPELKVTVAWDDHPGLPLSDPALVNDLDLIVLSPSQVRHYPWTLNPASPDDPATRDGEDHINVIEQVVVNNPEAGVWQVAVTAEKLSHCPFDPQVAPQFSVPKQAFTVAGSPSLKSLLQGQ